MPQKRSQHADKELLVVLFKINIISACDNIYLIFLSDCFIYIFAVLGFVSFLFAFFFFRSSLSCCSLTVISLDVVIIQILLVSLQFLSIYPLHIPKRQRYFVNTPFSTHRNGFHALGGIFHLKAETSEKKANMF